MPQKARTAAMSGKVKTKPKAGAAVQAKAGTKAGAKAGTKAGTRAGTKEKAKPAAEIRPSQGRSLRHTVRFKASPQEVYDLLMVSERHAAFTHHAAKVSPKVDGLVSAYGGYIEARNVLLDPPRRIVQAWRTVDWPEGWYSTATWELKALPSGTQMTFIQDQVPDDDFEAINEGWVEHYWDKMTAYLERKGGRKA